MYHAAEANISVLKIQSADAIIKREAERDDEEERLALSAPLAKSSGAIK